MGSGVAFATYTQEACGDNAVKEYPPLMLPDDTNVPSNAATSVTPELCETRGDEVMKVRFEGS